MSKVNKLTDAEKYTIETKYQNDGEDVKEIANFLGRHVNTIKNYVKNNDLTQTRIDSDSDETEEVVNIDKNGRKKATMFINKSAGKNNKGVNIMTPAQASRSDELRNKRLASAEDNKKKKGIFTIFEEE
jgi:hypothetical protein